MNCIICNTYIGEQSTAGRKRKYCEDCKATLRQKARDAWRKRIAAQGKTEARPEKTAAELEAIKAKYRNPAAMDYAVGKLAGVLSDVLVTK